MSGSAGGGYVPPQSSNFNCDTGVLKAAVSSIDLAVLENQRVGDILLLELSEIETVILVNSNGETLGSIAHRSTIELIHCIKNGNAYQATITTINTPACNVRIERI